MGPEPQGIPRATFLAPIGSPYGNFSHFRSHPAQNFGADLARGVPPPQSQLFFWHILACFFGKVDFWPEKNAPARQRRPVATGLGNPSPLGVPTGVRAGPGTPILGKKTSKIVRNGSPCLRLARYSHHIDPTGSREPLGCLPGPETAKNVPLGPLRALGPYGALEAIQVTSRSTTYGGDMF